MKNLDKQLLGLKISENAALSTSNSVVSRAAVIGQSTYTPKNVVLMVEVLTISIS